jgi:hypothetical protein
MDEIKYFKSLPIVMVFLVLKDFDLYQTPLSLASISVSWYQSPTIPMVYSYGFGLKLMRIFIKSQ